MIVKINKSKEIKNLSIIFILGLLISILLIKDYNKTLYMLLPYNIFLSIIIFINNYFTKSKLGFGITRKEIDKVFHLHLFIILIFNVIFILLYILFIVIIHQVLNISMYLIFKILLLSIIISLLIYQTLISNKKYIVLLISILVIIILIILSILLNSLYIIIISVIILLIIYLVIKYQIYNKSF